ncbi:MAG: hypothetical protein OEZ39_02575 [Gammaproteobacteria bacterium]|nr:hypothetical protein [Gammaproteobacteria bacterium]MDH5650740.1 hypothetical protein [Gammaproteobacteria bacterium]
MLKHLFAVTCCLLFVIKTAAGVEPENRKYVETVINAFKAGDRTAIARLVKYPVYRDNPVPSINTEQELLQRFDEVFDAALIQKIAQSDPDKDWGEMGWRGIIFDSGQVWLEMDGTISKVNHETAIGAAVKEKLIARLTQELPTELQTFTRPVLDWQTKKFRVRVDDMGPDYRYASWSLKKNPTDKPDLVLHKGKYVRDGSGGNHHYDFRSGKYLYQVHVIMIGEDDAIGALVVSKGDKTVVNERIYKKWSKP